jgi:hypothetical protein
MSFLKDCIYISVKMIKKFIENEKEEEEWYNQGILTKKELDDKLKSKVEKKK